jgi:drug/metabolite transporter (DMT)-like permease
MSPIHVSLASTVIATTALLTVNAFLYSLAELLSVFSMTGVFIFVCSGVVGSGAGKLLSFTGIDRLGASVNTAIIGIYPVIATAFAFIMLAESITGTEMLGIGLAITGVIIISLSDGGDVSGWTYTDLLYPVTGATAYGAAAAIRRYGFVETPLTTIQATTLNEIAAMIVLLTYLLTVSTDEVVSVITPQTMFADSGLPATAYYYLLGSAVLNTVAIGGLSASLQAAPVFIGTTLSNTSALFAIGFSVIFLRDTERVTRVVVVGAAIVISGVILLSTPSLL